MEKLKLINIRGFTFKIRPKPNSDKGLVKGVLSRNEYNLSKEDLVGINTVIDIGGHIGSFSIFMSKSVKRVIAFEPAPDSYNLFLENITLNLCNNITLINKAVGGVAGTLQFNLGKTAGRNTLCDVVYTHPKEVISVECIDINTVLKNYAIEYPCILKVDIEGEEYRLFDSLTEDSLKNVRSIFLEAHQYPDKPWSYFSIVKKLTDLNYTIESVNPITVNPRICAVNIKAIKNDK